MMVMFDLPVQTNVDKTHYRHFHDFLLDDGFLMMQFSVYGRHCASREIAETHQRRVGLAVPPNGQIRVLQVTEAQFGRMTIFENYVVRKPEPAPLALEFW